jgi:phosphorylated CTD-interacting factor 1
MSSNQPRKRSAKARQRPLLAFKMHQLAPTKPTGAGEKFAALPNRVVAQGKRTVWAGATAALACKRASRRDDHARPVPSTEACRAGQVFKLRKALAALCGKHVPPALAFERWLFDDLLYAEIEGQRRSDPVLCGNTPHKTALETLKGDLARASLPEKDVGRIAKEVCRQTADATAEVRRYDRKQRGLPLGGARPSVVVQRHKHTLDVSLSQGKGPRRKRILKINHEHYAKLCALWRIHTLRDGVVADAGRQLEPNSDAEQTFHEDLYSLLARYYSLQGHGFQAACPETVFRVLRERLGVQHECFASPLNCFYGSYCSVFPDTDVPFGSVGSFWNFKVPSGGGSFEANPPFVHNVMVCMVDKLDSLFKDSVAEPGYPLSFAVIVPAWLEDSSYQRLCAHKFLEEHILISKVDHGFCDGAQHQRRDRYRASPYDTAVFLLQNEKGKRKWPSKGAAPHTNLSLEADLREAFATGVPTLAMTERRKREGRGFADEDGGGGVYKGKKKNRTGTSVSKRKQKEKMDHPIVPAPKKRKKGQPSGVGTQLSKEERFRRKKRERKNLKAQKRKKRKPGRS